MSWINRRFPCLVHFIKKLKDEIDDSHLGTMITLHTFFFRLNLSCCSKVPKAHSVNRIRFKLDVLMQTQNLLFSDDVFSIPNHSHLMIMVSCMFDPVVYLTDDNYFEIHGKHVNVQSIIEKYYLYILAWCHSGDSQLLCSSERLEDLLNLSENVEYKGKQKQDIARAFKGTNPACQFETGHQKNGDYWL